MAQQPRVLREFVLTVGMSQLFVSSFGLYIITRTLKILVIVFGWSSRMVDLIALQPALLCVIVLDLILNLVEKEALMVKILAVWRVLDHSGPLWRIPNLDIHIQLRQ